MEAEGHGPGKSGEHALSYLEKGRRHLWTETEELFLQHAQKSQKERPEIGPGFQTVRETAVGSGVQNLISAEVGSVPKFVVDTTGQVTAAAGIKAASVTADPCGTFPEGSIFYNDTSNYMCYCNGTDDVKMSDDTTACF